MTTINTFVFPIIRTDLILPALDSLRENTPPNFKTVVVNQTQSAQRYDEWDLELRELSDIVIQTKLNYGFGQAANLGTRLATTEYVTVCNCDVVFFSDRWWGGIMETFDRFPTALGIAPMSPKEPGWGYGEPGFRIHAELDECLENPEGVHDRLAEGWGESVVDGMAMWCVVFKRREWVELGMFDERFMKGGGEDYDALSRGYQAGYRFISSGRSWVWHHWGKSKDDPRGRDEALPPARPDWNKLSTKGFGDEGLYDPDCDCWGRTGVRTDPEVWRAPL